MAAVSSEAMERQTWTSEVDDGVNDNAMQTKVGKLARATTSLVVSSQVTILRLRFD